MSLQERLREHAIDQQWPGCAIVSREDAIKAAAELDRLQARVAGLEAAFQPCAEHQPNGGTRGQCLVCACIKLSAALSRIDYALEEPNEMGVSTYDFDCDEDRVAKRVAARVAELEVDAERYRHMRASAVFQDRNGPGLYWYLPRWDRGLPVGERLDAAIDTARKAKP